MIRFSCNKKIKCTEIRESAIKTKLGKATAASIMKPGTPATPQWWKKYSEL